MDASNNEQHTGSVDLESASAGTACQTTTSNFAYIVAACAVGFLIVLALLGSAFIKNAISLGVAAYDHYNLNDSPSHRLDKDLERKLERNLDQKLDRFLDDLWDDNKDSDDDFDWNDDFDEDDLDDLIPRLSNTSSEAHLEQPLQA
ncbi:hypothetical protein K6V98_00240 [Collinsella sp. AGMB00827]|uniref:Uncharacterized protein n=1 Tax=Collinsella ureilytica TaxID=2869515 RepID=A0ABS7MHG4_9ACTN|nr:hypothetical protein [Collinsella urealyticum]MBY4796799.1 hypothetical protein [Collinsella urealyticum]